MIITGAALTNIGSSRSSNQDCILAGSWKEQRSMSVPYVFEFSRLEGDVVLVADGMGGHRAGEHASNLVADAFLASERAPEDPDELGVFLKHVNRTVFDLAAEDVRFQGMGTTVAGLICHSELLLWFNVGDSKILRYRDDFLRQLSVDDLASTAIASRSGKAGLTQALGGAPEFFDIDPHVGTEPLVLTWRYLICSDGLTDFVSTSTIESILALPDEEAAQRLLDAALTQGAPDNVSIILMTVKAEREVERET